MTRTPRKVTWEGVDYATVRHCADVTGIPYQTLWLWKQKGFTCRADVEASRQKKQRKSSKLYLDYAIQRKVLGK